MKIQESQLREYERKNPYLRDFFDIESWEAWDDEVYIDSYSSYKKQKSDNGKIGKKIKSKTESK